MSQRKSREEILEKQVQQWLIDWFVAKGKIPTGKIATEKITSEKIATEKLGDAASQPARLTDYFEAGWLTSMEVVELVTDIEREFHMQFSDIDFQDPRFVTIVGLAALIVDHVPEAAPSR